MVETINNLFGNGCRIIATAVVRLASGKDSTDRGRAVRVFRRKHGGASAYSVGLPVRGRNADAVFGVQTGLGAAGTKGIHGRLVRPMSPGTLAS